MNNLTEESVEITIPLHICWSESRARVDKESKVLDESVFKSSYLKGHDVIVYCHGNAEDNGMCFAFMHSIMRQTNCTVVAVDYPGYGFGRCLYSCSETESRKGQRQCSEQNMLLCVEVVMNDVVKEAKHVFVLGKSIGSVPALHAVTSFNVYTASSGLILMAPIASAARVVLGKRTLACLPLKCLRRADTIMFDNVSRVEDVRVPTLILHAEDDDVVPIYNSRVLAEAIPKRFLEKLICFEQGKHNELEKKNEVEFELSLKAFILLATSVQESKRAEKPIATDGQTSIKQTLENYSATCQNT